MSLEYNPSGGAGAGNAGTTLDGVNLLNKLTNALVQLATTNALPSGAATEAKQDVIITRLTADTWTTLVGNSVAFTYYAPSVSGNPGTATNNVETAVYSDGTGVVFTQTFTYDIDSNILTIVIS